MRTYENYFFSVSREKTDKPNRLSKEEWGEKSKEKFLTKLYSQLEMISEFPKKSNRSNIVNGLFKTIITKHTSLYYRISDGTIEVITIIDNRQNPEVSEQEILKWLSVN